MIDIKAVSDFAFYEETSNTEGAFSISHSIVKALPAISPNSRPGSRDLMSVAEVK